MSNHGNYIIMTPEDDRLIDEIIKGIRAEISHNNESVNKQLQRILEQTTKTNGRVSKIESETAIWRWFERKPGRFVLIVMFFLIMSAEGVRSIVQSLL